MSHLLVDVAILEIYSHFSSKGFSAAFSADTATMSRQGLQAPEKQFIVRRYNAAVPIIDPESKPITNPSQLHESTAIPHEAETFTLSPNDFPPLGQQPTQQAASTHPEPEKHLPHRSHAVASTHHSFQ